MIPETQADECGYTGDGCPFALSIPEIGASKMLNADDIRFLLEQLEFVTVYEDSESGRLRLQRRTAGWAENDPQRGRIQAALSIMLEVAVRHD